MGLCWTTTAALKNHLLYISRYAPIDSAQNQYHVFGGILPMNLQVGGLVPSTEQGSHAMHPSRYGIGFRVRYRVPGLGFMALILNPENPEP